MAETTPTIDMQVDYQELRKSRCEWCAKEWPLSFPTAPTHTGYEGSEPDNGSYNGTGVFRFHPCTAPTAEAAYAEARAQVAALTAERDALMRITAEKINAGIERRAQDFMLKEPNRLITQDGRIAALEAELAAANQDTERLADRIVREVAEIPDRFSPEDDPRMMLVRDDELRTIIIAAMLAARAPEITEGIGHDETAA